MLFTIKSKAYPVSQLRPKLAILISTFNEMKVDCLKQTLSLMAQFQNFEIIFIDGGSTDQTLQVLTDFQNKFKNVHDIKILKSSFKLRSERLNEGLRNLNSGENEAEMILFYHPRSLLTKEGLEILIAKKSQYPWGGFTHKFDHNHFVLKFTSWYSNKVRMALQKIIYLDHCIFVQKRILNKLSHPIWPETDIFEDTEFCQKLKKLAYPMRISHFSTTSAVRFQKNGIFKQSYMNQVLKLGYYLNLDRKRMNAWYEKKLGLNTKY